MERYQGKRVMIIGGTSGREAPRGRTRFSVFRPTIP